MGIFGVGNNKEFSQEKASAGVVDDLVQFNPVKGENGRPYPRESRPKMEVSKISPETELVFHESSSPAQMEQTIWDICPIGSTSFDVYIGRDGKTMNYTAETSVSVGHETEIQAPSASVFTAQDHDEVKLEAGDYELVINHRADVEYSGKGAMVNGEECFDSIKGESSGVSERWRISNEEDDLEGLEELCSAFGGTYSVYAFETCCENGRDERAETLGTGLSAHEAVETYKDEADPEEPVRGGLGLSQYEAHFYGLHGHLEGSPLTGTIMGSVVPERTISKNRNDVEDRLQDESWSTKVFESPLP